MRVRFTVSLDDKVDANLRALARSKVYRSWHWERFVSTLLLVGPLLFAIYLEDRAARVGIALLAIALYVATLRQVSDSYTIRYLRKFFREQMGGDVPFEVTVELTPGEISTRWQGQRWDFDWVIVEEIHETSDSVDFHTRYGGIVVVRKRAVDSPDAMRQFVELAERYRTDAQRQGGAVKS